MEIRTNVEDHVGVALRDVVDGYGRVVRLSDVRPHTAGAQKCLGTRELGEGCRYQGAFDAAWWAITAS